MTNNTMMIRRNLKLERSLFPIYLIVVSDSNVTPPVIAPFTNVNIFRTIIHWSLLPPINTEATTITTSLPEILFKPFSYEVLDRHHCDLIEKILCAAWPESVKKSGSEKRLEGEYKSKKEQDESHDSKMSANQKTTTNYRLYHALMEALIADEVAMDKEVTDQDLIQNQKPSETLLQMTYSKMDEKE
ncbi:hypothetical protein Tco_0012104 [Tanacetum coccineum]